MKKLRYQTQFFNILRCIFYTSISGAFVGTIVSLYNYLAIQIGNYSFNIYKFINNNLAYLPLMYLALIVLALLMYFTLKNIPEIKGSGIPQTKGAIKGLLTFKWLRTLIGTFFTTMISFFVGLSVGSEGPSVQIGAAGSEGAGKILKANPNWNRYLIRGGASAGIATAFNAPLTGVMFSIEESHDYFSPLILIATLCSVLMSAIVSNSIYTALKINKLMFDLNVNYVFTIKEIYYPLILGLVIGICSLIFNKLMIETKKLDKKLKMPNWAQMVIIFLIIGTSNVFFSDGIGSGHRLILKLATTNYIWYSLIVLLLVKTILTLLAFKSTSTGGLFFPMLTIGAIISALCATLFTKMGLSENAYNTIVICGMAAFLGAVARTPLTALLAIIETSKFNAGFLGPVITVFTAYIIMEITLSTPIYEELTSNLVKSVNEKRDKKVLNFESFVEKNSFMDGKYVRDILWPENYFILHIIRNGEMHPVKGHTKILANDIVVAQATTYKPKEVTKTIESLTHNRKMKHLLKNKKAT